MKAKKKSSSKSSVKRAPKLKAKAVTRPGAYRVFDSSGRREMPNIANQLDIDSKKRIKK
jgi:hypothetical protein|tara:strand:+ start:189 stop:365 length:177 start_codon:yes stop_codon:yes gene_type:complete